MDKRIECTILGKVQGVFFRSFIEQEAKRYSIYGCVENKNDGTVFVIAEGEEGHLESFLSNLEHGSEMSKVDSMDTKWSDATGEFSDFKVVY
jgi:acylphosphatase